MADLDVEQYWTPSNVGLYINGAKIDTAYRVDWQMQSGKTPLFSWSDQRFRAMTNGRLAIGGRLICHFRWPGYLTAAIKEAGGKKPLRFIGGVSEEERKSDRIRGELKETADIAQFQTSVNLARHMMKLAVAGRDAKEMELHSKLIGTLSKTETVSTINYTDKDEPTVSKSVEELPPFDIQVFYGRPDIDTYHVRKTLKDVYIVGEGQTISASANGGGDMSSSGSPIYEVYNFICRTIEDKVFL